MTPPYLLSACPPGPACRWLGVRTRALTCHTSVLGASVVHDPAEHREAGREETQVSLKCTWGHVRVSE